MRFLPSFPYSDIRQSWLYSGMFYRLAPVSFYEAVQYRVDGQAHCVDGQARIPKLDSVYVSTLGIGIPLCQYCCFRKTRTRLNISIFFIMIIALISLANKQQQQFKINARKNYVHRIFCIFIFTKKNPILVEIDMQASFYKSTKLKNMIQCFIFHQHLSFHND